MLPRARRSARRGREGPAGPRGDGGLGGGRGRRQPRGPPELAAPPGPGASSTHLSTDSTNTLRALMWIQAMKASLKFTLSQRSSGPCRDRRAGDARWPFRPREAEEDAGFDRASPERRRNARRPAEAARWLDEGRDRVGPAAPGDGGGPGKRRGPATRRMRGATADRAAGAGQPLTSGLSAGSPQASL